VANGLWLHNSRIHLSLAGIDYMVGRDAKVFRNFLAEGEERN
jgi:hypothetical protein